MDKQTQIFYDLAKKQTAEAARLYARVEELESLLKQSLDYLYPIEDRGPIGSGWKSDDLILLLQEIELTLEEGNDVS